MVRRVVSKLVSLTLDPQMNALLKSGSVNLACKLPWEYLVTIEEPTPREFTAPIPALMPPAPAPEPAPVERFRPMLREASLNHREPRVLHPKIERPGCTAADGSLLAHGYLTNLAEGKEGFGVLRIGKERLEEGARAASRLGQEELAGEMSAIAGEMPAVHDTGAAQQLADRLKPVVDQAWILGARCKGGLPTREVK